jgi:type IX secretion system PorP/SprF family membrane protein
MKKAIFFLSLCALFFPSRGVFAQQDLQISQYMFNNMYFNPAFAGVEGFAKLTALHRSQWAGYASTFDGRGGAPTSQIVTFTAPLYSYKSGAGFHIANDQLGPLNNMEAQFSYAYHLGIRDAKLSLGVRAGIFSQTINFDMYRAINPDDPIIEAGRESQVRPDLAFGAYFRSEKVFAGVSVNHILRSEFDFGSDVLRNPLETHMIITGGYDYELNYNLIVTPSVLVRTDLNQYSFDLSAMATYNDKMWGGMSFRQGEALIALLGYSLLKDNSLSVGYAFDLVIAARDAKKPTSHELMLSYTLPISGGQGRKVVRTPRFRF